MERVLSQDEVNALLTGLDEGQGDAAGAVPEGGEGPGHVTAYNLGSKEHVNWGHLPSLQMIAEKFARAFQEDLSSSLLDEVVLQFDGFLYKPFQEFVNMLPIPSSFTICRLEPLQGNGILIMGAEMVTHMVDLFFGGKAQTHVKIEGRDFTPIERHFIHKVSTGALTMLRDAWEGVHPITFEYQRTEINPQFAMVIGAADMAVCCKFTVELNHNTSQLYLVFPYSALEPIKEKLASIFKGEGMVADQAWVRRMHERTLETPVHVELELGRTEVPLGEVARWQPGDVVVLPNRVSEPLQLTIESVPKFWGHPGQRDGYLAFQVYGEIDTRPQGPEEEGEQDDGR
jgi:flagellar motor switch protein FliM